MRKEVCLVVSATSNKIVLLSHLWKITPHSGQSSLKENNGHTDLKSLYITRM
jgi:hypothetical protein